MNFLKGLKRPRSRSSGDSRPRLCIACDSLSIRRLLECGPALRSRAIAQQLSFANIKSQRYSCSLCDLLYASISKVCYKICGRHDRKIQDVLVSTHAKHQICITVSGTYRRDLNFQDRDAYKHIEFKQSFYLQEIYEDLQINSSGFLIEGKYIDYCEVRSWLEDCGGSHGLECHPATRNGFVGRPQRLLVVDVEDMCLADLPHDGKYVALSYVWGGVQLLHLNKENARALRVPKSLLSKQFSGDIPATIADAIEVTRAIGLRYIWIDSLCIQQDQVDETNYQVSNMHNIYGSAHVAIVAADGKSADTGLLGTSLRPREVPYGLCLATGAGNVRLIRTVADDLTLAFVTLGNWKLGDFHRWNIARADALPKHTSIADGPWNSRAWCFQEALLSSRALVFTDGQVFWHCNKSVWSESFLGRKVTLAGRAIDSRYKALGNLASSTHFQGSWNKHDASIELRRDGRSLVVSSEGFLLYKHIVAAYTPRDIGKLDDRLAAFDGIGKVLEQCLHSSLLFGLPETMLDAALLWHGQGPLTNIQSKVKSFPSWSWCSWVGAIKYAPQFGIEHHKPRKLYELESPEERIRPLVRWYKSGPGGKFEPINDRGFGIREALLPTGSMPEGWDGVLAPSENRNIDIDDIAPATQLLRCFTMKCTVSIGQTYAARLREEIDFETNANSSSISEARATANKVSFDSDDDYDIPYARTALITNNFRIYNKHGMVIGEVVLDEAHSLAAWPSGDEGRRWDIDMIALSETQFYRSSELNFEKDLYKQPFDYTLYNVMAVVWSKDGTTAYRRGLGRVSQVDWDALAPELRWVNLG